MDFVKMVAMLVSAPTGQLDESWRKKAAQFTGTQADAYDFLAEINQLDSFTISPFVRTMCDVKRFYARPDSGTDAQQSKGSKDG
jgi:tellurite resistance protein